MIWGWSWPVFFGRMMVGSFFLNHAHVISDHSILCDLAKNQGLEIPGEFCEFEQGQHSKPQKRQKRQKGREIGSGWGCYMFEGSWRWKPWFSECVLQVFPNTNPLNWTSDTFHREMLEKYVWGDHVNNSNIQLWSENHFICWVWFHRNFWWVE